MDQYKYGYHYGATKSLSGVNGVRADGALDYVTREADLTGAVDGQNITIALRARWNGDDGIFTEFFNSTGNVIRCLKREFDRLDFIIKSSVTGLDVVSIRSSLDSIKDGNYINILMSAKLGATAAAHLLIDGVSDISIITLTQGDTMDLTAANWSICANIAGSNKNNFDLNFFYYDHVYYNFSILANERLFFDALGNPVLSPTGNGTPSGGTQPLIYQAGLFNQWQNNKGPGGGMVEHGEFTQPPD